MSSLTSSPRSPLWTTHMTLPRMTGSLFSTLWRAVSSRQHLEIRFRAPRCMEDWRLRMNGGSIVEDSSRGSFLLPGKRKVNIKYSRSNFVWMEAESHLRLLLTQMRHIGARAVIPCIRKERCYLREQLLLTESASVVSQVCRLFPHQTQSRALFIVQHATNDGPFLGAGWE